MKIFKKSYLMVGIFLCAVTGMMLTSCSDNMPEGSRYTFKGQMLSQYLEDPDHNCQLYAQICRKAGRMDMFSSYGRYTCFAPTDTAMASWMLNHGYTTVADIPEKVCDTICRNHVVSNLIASITDLRSLGETPTPNMLGLPMTLLSTSVSVEGVEYETIRLKNSANMLYNQQNDSVENGIVHAVDAVIPTASDNVTGMMSKDPNISLYYSAVELTGLSKRLLKYKDYNWDPEKYKSKSRHIYTGAQNDWAFIPETKYYGYTIFTPTNEALRRKGITNLQSFYDYARSIYGGPELNLAQNEDGSFVDPEAKEAIEQHDNALYRICAYHCLDRKATYDKLTSFITTDVHIYNPTEWYSTMDSLTTIKVTSMTVREDCDEYHITSNFRRPTLFLNNAVKKGIRGAMVDRCEDVNNEGDNGYYYYIDDLVDYGEETKSTVFNDRIRMDMYSFFKVLVSNNLRNTAAPLPSKAPEYQGDDKDCKDYLLLPEYLADEDVVLNEDGDFLYQNVRQTYWSFQGDEFNLCSQVNSYDIEFNLPSVPEGTYQLRLGFADMPTRGICQFYFDGEPKGLPFDMRDANFTQRTGFKPLYASESSKMTDAEKKSMHNLGWYHGPFSIVNTGDDYNSTGTFPSLKNNDGARFSQNSHTVRYVLGNEPIYITEGVQHRIRIKSVWAVGTALVMMDYFELVPKSIYGAGEEAGQAEDDL